MFTGIVEETGTVSELTKSADSMIISIRGNIVLEGTKKGDSIAVNGICVTVTETKNKAFSADLSPETIEKTSLRLFRPGDTVNLERALSPTTRFGGHFVTGHIDGTGIIDSIVNEKDFWRFTIGAPSHLMKYIASKGSVALNGVSLTPYDCTKDAFSVMIIPHTLESTALKTVHTGDTINIECDILSKYIEQLLFCRGDSAADEENKRKIDADFLRKTGFLI
jgi:riboflavin synthase